MPRFLRALEAEAELVRRLGAHTEQTECPDFGDLWWDKIDLKVILNDPGIKFETPSRMFVIASINGDLRYFAGGKDLSDESYDYELGTFDKLRDGLTFAETYLIAGIDLRDIHVKRQVRRARLEARHGGVRRLITDHQVRQS